MKHIPAGVKLLALLAFSIAVLIIPGWVPALIAVVLGLALVLAARMPVRDLFRVLRIFMIVGALLFAFQFWQHGLARAIEVVGDILALILAASAMTASTTADELIDTITRGLRPFTSWGVAPERVALAFSLAIRSLPVAFAVARETLVAAKARGLRTPRAFAVPVVIRMVAHARATGAAMHARGLGDDPERDELAPSPR